MGDQPTGYGTDSSTDKRIIPVAPNQALQLTREPQPVPPGSTASVTPAVAKLEWLDALNRRRTGKTGSLKAALRKEGK